MSGGGYWLLYIRVRWRSTVSHRNNPQLVLYYLNIKEAMRCVHMRRLVVRMHVQTLCYEVVIDFACCEMRHRLLNWESCVAAGVVVLPSGECSRRWNCLDLWCCHLLVGLKVVVAFSLSSSHHFGGWIETGTFRSRAEYPNH
ncbi:hypothetical protein AVEN_84144-1 [Araneus ventricosus]|uniref:Uncharacterized protein n=1 Tax=Araneus ventricosus TaxID=182803 RepID=A0A4Y2KT81_ARAVE|nr:hypothetical protein AVEN_84144-1 [Araneus ventricosus]